MTLFLCGSFGCLVSRFELGDQGSRMCFTASNWTSAKRSFLLGAGSFRDGSYFSGGFLCAVINDWGFFCACGDHNKG
jgi:hypothetical protein